MAAAWDRNIAPDDGGRLDKPTLVRGGRPRSPSVRSSGAGPYFGLTCAPPRATCRKDGLTHPQTRDRDVSEPRLGSPHCVIWGTCLARSLNSTTARRNHAIAGIIAAAMERSSPARLESPSRNRRCFGSCMTQDMAPVARRRLRLWGPSCGRAPGGCAGSGCPVSWKPSVVCEVADLGVHEGVTEPERARERTCKGAGLSEHRSGPTSALAGTCPRAGASVSACRGWRRSCRVDDQRRPQRRPSTTDSRSGCGNR